MSRADYYVVGTCTNNAIGIVEFDTFTLTNFIARTHVANTGATTAENFNFVVFMVGTNPYVNFT